MASFCQRGCTCLGCSCPFPVRAAGFA
ncbi:hypothetical protein SOVF_186120, partial [Spinacia oleracea]